MALAFTFPGQGSQVPGMGRELAAAFPAAREVFQEIDDTLNQKLSKLMFEGQAIDITLTSNAQPALMAVSLAVLRVLEKEGGLDLRSQVALVAGHSLGEYSALAAAGSFDVATAARLLRLRGDAMQQAVPAGDGAMAALLGAELEQAQAICDAAAEDPLTQQREVVQVANDNGGGQIVVSGHAAAVDRAIERAKAAGVKRAMKLPVSAPFHCSLMSPAADAMAEALDNAAMCAPAVPLVANVTAGKVTDPAAIRDLLVRQVTGTVRWRECILAMGAMGVDRFVEIGQGRILTGLMKRLAPEATASAVGTPADIEAFLEDAVTPWYDLTGMPSPAEDAAVRGALRDANAAAGFPYDTRPLAVLLRDGAGTVVGGLVGRSAWSWLYIENFAVPPALRGAGWGRRLLHAAEAEALRRGCIGGRLDTYSFQARGFYERLGYRVIGTLEDCPPGQTRFSMARRFAGETG